MLARLCLAPTPDRVGSVIHAPSPIRVVLADDRSLMRRVLRLLLDGEDGLEVVAEAVDLASAVRLVHSLRPHVLVLDLSMLDGSSIATIGKLRAWVPDTQIVVLTMDDISVFAQRALAAGALGFVLKDLADIDLPPAVRAAARGEQYVSPRVAARIHAAQNLKIPPDPRLGCGGVPAVRP